MLARECFSMQANLRAWIKILHVWFSLCKKIGKTKLLSSSTFLFSSVFISIVANFSELSMKCITSSTFAALMPKQAIRSDSGKYLFHPWGKFRSHSVEIH